MYQTIKATVRKGKIELLEAIVLPENATLLVTVLEADDIDKLTLGEHLVGGLQDILSGKTHKVQNEVEMTEYLDAVFQQ